MGIGKPEAPTPLLSTRSMRKFSQWYRASFVFASASQQLCLFNLYVEGKQVLIWRCKSLNCVTSGVESINLMNMPTLELFALRGAFSLLQQRLSYELEEINLQMWQKQGDELSSGKVFVVEKYDIAFRSYYVSCTKSHWKGDRTCFWRRET